MCDPNASTYIIERNPLYQESFVFSIQQAQQSACDLSLHPGQTIYQSRSLQTDEAVKKLTLPFGEKIVQWGQLYFVDTYVADGMENVIGKAHKAATLCHVGEQTK